MQKTVVVAVERLVRHDVYRKTIKRTSTFMAHDEKGAKKGDTVRIVETRPLSKSKRWRVEEIVAKATVTDDDAIRRPRPSGREARHDPDANDPRGGRQLRRPQDLLHPAARRVDRPLRPASGTSSPPTSRSRRPTPPSR